MGISIHIAQPGLYTSERMATQPSDDPKGLVPRRRTSQALSSVRIDLQALMREWLEQLKPNTRRAYERALQDFAAFMKAESGQEAAAALFAMTQGDANAAVFQYRSALSKGGLRASSVNLKLSAILAMNKLCRMAGFVPWTIEVPLLKVESYRDTRGVGANAVEPILTKLEKAPGAMAARDLAVLTLIYRQGLRRGEVASLDARHLRLEKNRLDILGKSRTDREEITLTPRTVAALQNWLTHRPAEGAALFPSMDRAHRGNRLNGNSIWRIVVGYKLGRPHGVRHTAISEVLVRSDGNLLAAQQFARHKDPKVTMRYWDKIKDIGGQAARLLDKDRAQDGDKDA